jgi:hypothetical protein
MMKMIMAITRIGIHQAGTTGSRKITGLGSGKKDQATMETITVAQTEIIIGNMMTSNIQIAVNKKATGVQDITREV